MDHEEFMREVTRRAVLMQLKVFLGLAVAAAVIAFVSFHFFH